MIWDYIRDFLVQYVFGGVDSNETFYQCMIYYDIDDGNSFYSTNFVAKLGESPDGMPYYVSIGDWLSTTATIIIMCIAVFLMIMLVRWVWRLVTSAFLLK